MDHSFLKGDTAFFRYSIGAEHGFMPQMLPGFGFNHDNLAQQSVLAWSHTVSQNVVNAATLAVSRLAMTHTTESAYKNDIISQLGINGLVSYPSQWGGRTSACRAIRSSVTTGWPLPWQSGTRLLKDAIR